MATRSPSLMSPMATPAQAAFMGTPAPMREREVPQTEAMEDEPLDSRTSETTLNGVGEVIVGWEERLNGLLRQCPMPRFPSVRAPVGLGLTGGKRREIIVEHEGLGDFFAGVDGVDPLLVPGRSQSRDSQRLGLTPGEERRTVSPGKNANLTGDGTEPLPRPRPSARSPCGEDPLPHGLFLDAP